MIRPLILLALLTSMPLALAGANKQTSVRKLELTGEMSITDDNGVVIPKLVLSLTAGNVIKIKRTDGFEYQGVVAEVEESKNMIRIFGYMTNSKKTHFGFIIAEKGQFVGAIIDEAKDETYVMEFIEAAKGFVFVREIVAKKPGT